MMRFAPIVLLVSALVLSGCGVNSSAPDGGSAQDQTPEDSGQNQASAEGTASAFSPSMDCNAVGELVTPIVDGMFLADFSYVNDSDILCMWSSTPGAGISEGSALDVIVAMWQDDSYGPPDALAAQCDTTRSVASGLDALSGCIYEDVAGDFTWDALIPYFKIRIAYSCEGTINCTPPLPANADELVVNAFSTLGGALAAG